MRRALLAIVVLLAMTPSAWGQAFDRQTLLRVLLATDARQVAACERLGILSDTSPEDLRKKIIRMGGDAGLVTFDAADPDKMNAEVYRCQKVTTPAVPSGVAGGDQIPLLGTWIGTLTSLQVVPGAGRTQFPATVRVWEEGGQLRWTMEVGGRDLDGSGTVTRVYGDIALTGTYGRQGLPITYSLRLSGQTLEGSGAGPDNIVRTLTLRKQQP